MGQINGNGSAKKWLSGGGIALVGFVLGKVDYVSKMDDRWLMIALGMLIIAIGLFHYNGVLQDLRASRVENKELAERLIVLVENSTAAYIRLEQAIIASGGPKMERAIGPHS